MSVYVVGVLKMRDPSWVPEYLEKVPPLVARHGGVYHVRADQAEVLENLCGRLPGTDLAVVIEFPSAAHAKAWYGDPDYQAMIRLRQTGSAVDLMLYERFPGFATAAKPAKRKAAKKRAAKKPAKKAAKRAKPAKPAKRKSKKRARR
jgi:uncharacterized protein (DUF1330 family)